MMPQELVEYLHTMISPADRVESCVVHIVHDPVNFDWASQADASAHGMIFDPSTLSNMDHYVAEAYRILKPGAHLLLVAPDEEPTGHTGACQAEDAGFEVRDAILWAYGEDAGGKIHYTAKASRSEREEGLYGGGSIIPEPSYVLKAGLSPETVAEIKARLLDEGIDPEIVAAL
jgi:hypothetical protein